MKKFLSLTLALAMLGTALTGCSSKDAASLREWQLSSFGMTGRTFHFGMKMDDSHIRKKIRFLLDLYFFLK